MKPTSDGYYISVAGETYDARTAAARSAIRRAGMPYAPIERWDGHEWHQTGRVLHPSDGPCHKAVGATLLARTADLVQSLAAMDYFGCEAAKYAVQDLADLVHELALRVDRSGRRDS